MKNLNELNVQELKQTEMRKIDGGWGWVFMIGFSMLWAEDNSNYRLRMGGNCASYR